MKKQLCAALLAGSMLTTSVVFADRPVRQTLPEPVVPISAPAPANETATVTIGDDTVLVDGQKIKLPFAPYINKGVTMIPLEALAQFLNTRPTYNPQDDTVTINHQGKNMVSFRLGDAEVRLGNGKLKKLPALTELIGNRTAIPLRALAEIFDIVVHYENGVITLVRKAHQDYLIGFQAFDGKLLTDFDYSLTPKAYVGYAKDYLTDYPQGEGNTMILAISQPGQEMMIESIEVKEDRVVVHVIPESRWSNAPEGTMGLIHYGARRVVKLLDKLPEGLQVEIDGYELPTQNEYRVGFLSFEGKLLSKYDYSLEPKVYVGPAKDYLTGYPKGEDNTNILAVSQPGQELMIQGIEVHKDKVVVRVIPESRWSNAPAGTMSLIHYGPRRVVRLLDKLPEGLRVEVDGYELPAKAVVKAEEVATADFNGSLQLSHEQLNETSAFTKLVTTEGKEQLVLVAALGERNTGGYAIDILWVEKAENKLIVHAKETTPAPGAAVIQAITYPYQAVVIDNTFKSWAVELDLVKTVEFTLANWGPATQSQIGEQGVTKTIGADGKLLLTACAGEQPNPGYRLTIERVEQENNLLVVHARLSEPAPGTIWAQVISYPRDMVAVSADYSNYAVQLVLH